MNHSPRLSPYQRELITTAANRLPLRERDDFIWRVSRQLGGYPTDIAVQAAIDNQLALNRLPSFGCDRAPLAPDEGG